MELKVWQKNVLSLIVIVGVGFILFNVAFVLAALVINGTSRMLGADPQAAPPLVGMAIYLVLILLLSWFVFRSKLNDLVKATFLTMPLMVILMMVGVRIYQQSQWIIVGIGAAIVGAVIVYLYSKKLSWHYYFATVYVALLALMIMLTGMEI
jgi:hypothetical protein